MVGDAIRKEALNRLGTDRLPVIRLKLVHREIQSIAPAQLASIHELVVHDVAVGISGVFDRALRPGDPDRRAEQFALMQVAQKTAVTVSLDSLFVARQLSDAARAVQIEIGILAEVDVGLGRVGVAPGEALLQLVRGIDRLPRLRFEGIAFYPGMIRSLDEEGEEALKRLVLKSRRVPLRNTFTFYSRAKGSFSCRKVLIELL